MNRPAPTPACTDPSCCATSLPVLYLTGGSILWLLAGLGLALLASLKQHQPWLLASCEWVTYGRLDAASRTALVHGFFSQMGLGLGLWLLARTGGTQIAAPGIVFIAGLVWNAVLTLGVAGILVEGPSGHSSLELPGQLVTVLTVVSTVLCLLGFATFAKRTEGPTVPTQWFVLAALLALPLFAITSQVTLSIFPERGVLQAVIDGWNGQGLLLLWLAPLALASLYFFIPDIGGRPLRSPAFAKLGFWAWVFFASWTGASNLVGGPVPAWMVTVSIAASVLLLIPVAFISLNLHGVAPVSALGRSTALRFAALSAISFTVVGILTALTAPRCAQQVLGLTQFTVAVRELFLFGFVGPALFAGYYAVVPKLAGRGFPCRLSPVAHLGLTVLGLGIMVLSCGVGGWLQGWALADCKVGFPEVAAHLQIWLKLHTLGLAVFAFGQTAVLANSVWLLVECLLPFGKPALALFTETSPAGAGK
ncbi:MAG: cbb3-type cytochrome c oxidase subunit I [Verrucomicrobiota bacterium]